LITLLNKGEYRRIDAMQHRSFELEVSGGRESGNGYVYMKHGDQYNILCRNHRSVRCDVELFIDGKSIGTWRIPANSSITVEHSLHDNGRFTFYKKGSKEAKIVDTSIPVDDSGLIKAVFTPEKITVQERVVYVNPWPYSWVYPWVYPWYYQSPIWMTQTQPLNQTIVSFGADNNKGFDNGNGFGNVTCNYVAQGHTSLNCMNQDIKAECNSKLEAGITGLSGHSNQVFHSVEPMTLDYAETTNICLRLVVKRKRGNKGPRPLLDVRSTPVPPPVK